MLDKIRSQSQNILVVGNHTGIIQSILDFDYAAGRETPSVQAIISSGRKRQKFFWGNGEILIPVYGTIEEAAGRGVKVDWLLCISSPSSTPRMVDAFFAAYPEAHGAHLFAEGVSERDAVRLIEDYGQEKIIAGPSGVGLCIPTVLKLGAIGGIKGERLAELGASRGTTAVICSSGGMVNEVMYQVVAAGSNISFAACYGGDRFPITSPLQWFELAEADKETKEIAYFGELGGQDEYVLRDAIKAGKINKPIFAYIAGRYESKDEKIQFGHAKALAKAEAETAVAKMEALRGVGVNVAETFNDFMEMFRGLNQASVRLETARNWTERPTTLTPTLYSAPTFKHTIAESFTAGIAARILGVEKVSAETSSFLDLVFTELIDHGPHVSGAINSMITTRAGRDMSSALAAGVLTVGDRFGGAMNGAAKVWFNALQKGLTASQVVDDYAKRREYILGIGHLKYNVYKPDPRVAALIAHGKSALQHTPHLDLSLEIEALTSKKRANLILNVDGVTAALLLDYLTEKEGYSKLQLQELIEIEFFNALFLIPRSVGFVGNYLDQKRIDEGLFRLSEKDSYNF
jgi:ATP citrate (pro-S)-lyase